MTVSNTTERSRRTRQKLLDAFTQELACRPLHHLRITDITRRAYTSSSTFYQYFPSLDAALDALAEQLDDEYSARLTYFRANFPAGPQDSGTYRTVLRTVAEDFFRFHEQHQVVLSALGARAVQEDDDAMSAVLFPLVRELEYLMAEGASSARHLLGARTLAWRLLGVAQLRRTLESSEWDQVRADALDLVSRTADRLATGESADV